MARIGNGFAEHAGTTLRALRRAGRSTFGAICMAAGVLSLCSTNAAAAGWYTGEIATVQLNKTGNIFVWVNGSINHECGSTRLDYVLSNESTGKSILAALLSWQAQGKAATFYIESCNGSAAMFSDVRNAN